MYEVQTIFLCSWTSKYLEKLVQKSPSYNYYNTKNSQCCRCSRIYVNLTFYVRNAKIARISHVFSRLTYYFFKHCTKTQDQVRYHLDNHLRYKIVSARLAKILERELYFTANYARYQNLIHTIVFYIWAKFIHQVDVTALKHRASPY